MSDKGIIFSAAMVRALLAGTKTQTRRLLQNPEYYGCPTGDCPHEKQVECDAAMGALTAKETGYAPGQRLYVREAWSVRGVYTDVVEVGYRASQNSSHTEYVEQWPVAKAVPGKGQWPRWPKYGPSIYMPRWASRLWLEVTDVRVQRLQEISEADAKAEGIVWKEPTDEDRAWAAAGDEETGESYDIDGVWTVPGMAGVVKSDVWGCTPQQCYQFVWNSLHKKPGETWLDNPWIVAVSFAVHKGNIDQ